MIGSNSVRLAPPAARPAGTAKRLLHGAAGAVTCGLTEAAAAPFLTAASVPKLAFQIGRVTAYNGLAAFECGWPVPLMSGLIGLTGCFCGTMAAVLFTGVSVVSAPFGLIRGLERGFSEGMSGGIRGALAAERQELRRLYRLGFAWSEQCRDEANVKRERWGLIRQYRDVGESARGARLRLEAFAKKVGEAGASASDVNNLIRYAGDHKDALCAQLACANRQGEVLAAAQTLLINSHHKYRVPLQQGAALLTRAQQERRADEDLPASCERLSLNYFLTEDFGGELLPKRVGEAVQRGQLADSPTTLETVTAELGALRLLGVPAEQALAQAIDKVSRPTPAATTERTASGLTIAGIQVPVRTAGPSAAFAS